MFLDENDLLSESQYGFRPGRSTAEAIFDFCDDVLTVQNDSAFTAAIFIDIKKAFDCVNHSMLIDSLSRSNINPFLLRWLIAYLSERKQCTTVNGVKSSIKTVKYGVPQGSILGPILFIYFVNSITNPPISSKIKLYADDIVLYSSNKTPQVAIDTLQSDLNTIIKATDDIGLTINNEKNQIFLVLF